MPSGRKELKKQTGSIEVFTIGKEPKNYCRLCAIEISYYSMSGLCLDCLRRTIAREKAFGRYSQH